MPENEDHLARAVQLALDNVNSRGGRPFGAVLVKDGQVAATGVNEELATHDPTSHAEMEAIRAAARDRRDPLLEDHIMYASGHPCPMCLAAMYLAGIQQVYYAYSNEQAEPYRLSTRDLYAELAKSLSEQSMRMEHLPVPRDQQHPYEAWWGISQGSRSR